MMLPDSGRLRSSATPEGGCHGATVDGLWGPESLRSSATPEGGCHHRHSGRSARQQPVAILSHPEGWLPRWAAGSWVVGATRLRSARTPEGDGHPDDLAAPGLTNCCDPQPPRRVAATPGGRHHADAAARCDPQPPRRVAATRSRTTTPWFCSGVAILSHPGGWLPP